MWRDETLTGHDVAIAHFTDRHEALKVFGDYLHNDPPIDRILFFHGDGGNGKSLLLRYLREKHCRLLHDWDGIKQRSDDEFETALAAAKPRVGQIPVAYLDFGMQPQGKERPQEVLYALLMLRRQLGKFKLRFPSFDYAIIWRLHKLGESVKEQIRSVLPEDEFKLAMTMYKIIESNPYATAAQAAYDFINTKFKKETQLARMSRNFSEELLAKIHASDPHGSLLEMLPDIFARDLNLGMRLGGNTGGPERVVLFFDTVEALHGSEQTTKHTNDEWLRRLLLELKPSSGIVPVLAGRIVPRWDEKAARFPIEMQGAHSLDAHLLGHLPDSHAREYLDKVKTACIELGEKTDSQQDKHQIGIMVAALESESLRESLIHYSSARPGEVHPLHLGFCVDVVRAAAQWGVLLTPEEFADAPEFEQRNAQLVERFLKYVDEDLGIAVRAVSVCRGFDKEIFKVLAEAGEYSATAATFNQLTRLSFVRLIGEEGSERYRVHDTLRRLFGEMDADFTRRCHEVMEGYYRNQHEVGRTSATAEMIFHLNKLHTRKGLAAWKFELENALNISAYDLCSSLLAIQNELYVPDALWSAKIRSASGKYLAEVSQSGRAMEEYLAAKGAYKVVLESEETKHAIYCNLGNVLHDIGDLEASLAHYDEALCSYEEALTLHLSAIDISPNNSRFRNNKGNDMAGIGDILNRRSLHDQALTKYESAVESYNVALSLSPKDYEVYNNKGNVLKKIGDVQSRLSMHSTAYRTYHDAIDCYNTALTISPGNKVAEGNKGNVLGTLGDLQGQMALYHEALKTYGDAIVSYDAALRHASENPTVRNNKGSVLQRVGDLQAGLSLFGEAFDSYEKSLDCHDAVLKRAPDDIQAQTHRARTLGSLGNLQSRLTDYMTAMKSYVNAVEALNATISLTADDNEAHSTKGSFLWKLGDLQTKLDLHSEALCTYQEAIASFEIALTIAPDDNHAHNNMGNVWGSLGDLQVALKKKDEAFENFYKAVESYDFALRLAPDDIRVQTHKCSVLQRLGDLQASSGAWSQAEESYCASIKAANAALQLAPKSISALNNKGNLLESLGDMHVSQKQFDDAIKAYEQAGQVYRVALQYAAKDGDIHCNVANVLMKLGVSQLKLDNVEDARRLLAAAAAKYEEGLNLAPNDENMKLLLNVVLETLVNMSGEKT